MNTTMPIHWACVFLIGLMVTATSARAIEFAHYYDGSQRRSITLQTDLVAQFGNAEERSQALKAQSPSLLVAGDSLVRVYKTSHAVARGSRSPTSVADGAGAVYREGNSAAGRLMALPGGVLVKFRPDWSRQRIDAWLAERNLSVERQLEVQPNWFKVGTRSGDASLAAANEMFNSGEVLAAVPNWWKQTRPR